MASTSWNFDYHLRPHIAMLSFYHHPQKKTETGFMAGHWTLDTGHWTLDSHQTTSQTQQQLIPQQYYYDQAAAVTLAEPAFGKKFSQFCFNISMGAVSLIRYQSRHSQLSILHQKHLHCTLNQQPPENYATWRNFIFFLWFDSDFVDLWQPTPVP